ncbi:MAG TPA: Ig-like domain-containing protein [Chryseosolibacter sp.]
MTLSKNLHWFVCIIFLFSCARQTAPTGGPKDTIPPVLLRSIPQNEALNFKGNQIELQFSEDVILNTPKEQLIVTPTISKDYKITYRKNTVVLTLDEPLQDSTTYTFNFREAVQDITEKNPVRNLQLALSTGSYIDSLSIDGTVYNILRGKPVKDATVALHIENDTFNIFQHPTAYFTKTNQQGKFKISNLKPGNYFVYAFEDKNRNLVVNTRNEAYGFLGSYQTLQDTISDLSIGILRLDASPLKMTSARPYNTYFNIRMTKNLRTFHLTAADSSDLSYTFGENNANIRVYKTTDLDSLAAHLTAYDSLDHSVDTTLYIKYLTREVTPEKFDLSLQSTSLLADKGLLEATIIFTKPVKEINFDSLSFQVDSVTNIKFTAHDLTWDPLLRKFSIRKNIDPALYKTDANADAQPPRAPKPSLKSKAPEPTNQLQLGLGAFISIENDSSKRISQALKPMHEQDLSVINIDIRTKEKHFIVELVDANFKVIQQQHDNHHVRFQNVVPGEYQIRLIIDRNGNGAWDPGNYFRHVEPEPIIYYRSADGSTSIKGVKANWEIGTDGEMFITY